MNNEMPVKKRSLPNYTKDEEKFHVFSHAFGVLFGIAMIVIVSLYHENTVQLVAGVLFGLSLVVLYAMSCTYHALSPEGEELKDKEHFQVVDHCSIPILITGTYIPFAMCVLEPAKPGFGWTLLIIVCVLACAITILNIIDLDRFKVFTMIGYFLMGGSLLIGSDILINLLTVEGFILFVAGGLAYIIGAIFYGIGGKNKKWIHSIIPELGGKNKKWMHSVFHVFCILGSVLHCVCVYLYVFQY